MQLEEGGRTDRAVLFCWEDEGAASLGLDSGWVDQVITPVGDDGKIFDRYFGETSSSKVARGMPFWTEGGCMHPGYSRLWSGR